MADVHVDLDLLWELMGGAQLPGWLPTDAPHLALPGPHNVHAAFALVVLAQSLGAQLAPGEVPGPPERRRNHWEVSCRTRDIWFVAEPEPQPRGILLVHVPTLAGITDPMGALAAVVEWGGMLHGCTRLEAARSGEVWGVPRGKWPTWGWDFKYEGWGLTAGATTTWFRPWPDDVPALFDVSCPAAALRAVWAHLREVLDGS